MRSRPRRSLFKRLRSGVTAPPVSLQDIEQRQCLILPQEETTPVGVRRLSTAVIQMGHPGKHVHTLESAQYRHLQMWIRIGARVPTADQRSTRATSFFGSPSGNIRTYYWLLRSNSDEYYHNLHYHSDKEQPYSTTAMHSKSYQRELTHPHCQPIVQRTYRRESSGHSICEIVVPNAEAQFIYTSQLCNQHGGGYIQSDCQASRTNQSLDTIIAGERQFQERILNASVPMKCEMLTQKCHSSLKLPLQQRSAEKHAKSTFQQYTCSIICYVVTPQQSAVGNSFCRLSPMTKYSDDLLVYAPYTQELSQFPAAAAST